MKNLFGLMVCLLLMLFNACTMQETAYSDFDKNANFSEYKTYTWIPQDTGTNTNPIYNNPIIENNIRREVEQELNKRGYKLDKRKPDLLVKINLLVENKLGVISNPVYTTPNPNNQLNVIPPYNPFITNYGAYNNPNYNPYYNMQNSPYNRNYFANNYPYNNGYGYPAESISSFGIGYGIPSNSQTPYVIGTTQQTYEYKEGTIIVDMVDFKTNSLIWRGWGSNDITNPEAFENDLNKEIRAIFKEYPVK